MNDKVGNACIKHKRNDKGTLTYTKSGTKEMYLECIDIDGRTIT
jgi:hypothetical protein